MNLFTKEMRSVLTIAFVFAFIALAFVITVPTAKMQSGSNTIAFDRYDEGVSYTKVFTMNADGSNVTDLGRGFGPSWSGDGAKIAYGYGDSETSDVWTMNADGSNKQQLTQNWQSYAPAWSPDSQRVAFASSHEDAHVYLIDADGTDQVRLIHTAAGVVREYAPAWSGDGTKVIFLGQKVVNGLARYDYYAADANNSGATTQLTFVNYLFAHVRAAVEPNGSNIVLEYAHALQAFSLDGSGTIANLTLGSLLTPRDADYAPNGTKIIYTLGSSLHVMNADGSGVVNLDVVGNNPDWNPTAILAGGTPSPTPSIEADLAVQASVSNAAPAIGSQVTLTATVTNNGTNAATDALLTAQVPSSVVAGSANSSQGSCTISNGQVECPIGALANGGSATVTILATVNAVGFASTQFNASAAETDPDASNNTATANVNVVGPCAAPVTTPIEITRSQWRRDDRTGQDELILTIRNRADHNVDPRIIFVFDGLPAGVSIDPSVVAGYTQCAAPIGSPYLVTFAPNKKEWKPMQTVSVRVLFNNPSRAEIPYSWRLYSGNVNP